MIKSMKEDKRDTASSTPGQILHWNFFIGGHLGASVPVRLVERTDAGQLVWMKSGTPMWHTVLPRGITHLRDIDPHERPAEGFPVVAGRWPMGDALFYQPTGAAHSVLWLFGRRHKFRGWYVNLERRVHHGADIDISDHELDINVAPDRTWTWKDERSFAEKTGHPAYWTAEEAHAIRSEGTTVAQLAEAGTFPSTAPGAISGHRPGGRPHPARLPPATRSSARQALRPGAPRPEQRATTASGHLGRSGVMTIIARRHSP